MTKPTQWPCRGCGNLLSGKGGRIYCGPDCRPRCVVDGCPRPEHSKGWCSTHSRRASRHGDPLAPLQRRKNVGACEADECDRPSRKVGLCDAHYERSRSSSPPRVPASKKLKSEPLRTWSDVGAACVVCGSAVQPGTGRRKHCSSACQAMDSYHQGQRPSELSCNFCGGRFVLDRTRTGRMQRSDTKWCPDCGRDSPDVRRFKQYGVTKKQYDAAMARGCELCGAMKPLHVDHDHSCCPVAPGKRARSCGNCIRGFVCGPCNRGLGLFFDNIDALERAVAYLKRGGAKT